MGPDVVSPETLTEVTRDLFMWAEAFLASLLRPWNGLPTAYRLSRIPIRSCAGGGVQAPHV